MTFSLFVACPKNLEYLLADELRPLGLIVTKITPQGVYGDADVSTLYALCLWSRVASRVQLLLFNGEAYNPHALQQLCQQFPWKTVFSADKRFAVEFHGSSAQFRNAMYGAQVVKDGVVDYFQKVTGTRPNVDKKNPEVRLHAYLKNEGITVSLDFTGYGLHQRGYRKQAGDAPLKENLAAAALYRTGWPELAQKGCAFLDPFCGSGTLVIEAAMMAANIPPGILRDDQLFVHWAGHQADLWQKLKSQALQQVRPIQICIQGSDSDVKLIDAAKENALRAGVEKLVEFKSAPLEAIRAPAEKGLCVCNPPYGERLGELHPLLTLYQQLGHKLFHEFQGWQATVLTNNPLLAKAIGLRSDKQYSLYNGPLACKLYSIRLDHSNQLKSASQTSGAGAASLRNRLQKNWDHLKKWAKRNGIQAFRMYDADIPEYAFAVDWYDGFAVVQEYAPPASVPEHKAQMRNVELLQILPEILGIEPQKVILKERKRQKGAEQYKKLAKTKVEQIIKEGKARFRVNLSDYLDTGLFLDNRLMRLKLAQLPASSRLLNCFCYTATASVHAALNGVSTTNVDMSKTYLDWAKENFSLNGLELRRHQFIQTDCTEWLGQCEDKFDFIFLDPPSFSNSKRMKSTLDVQRDHSTLIANAMKLLNPGGCLWFLTNLRSFKLSSHIMEQYVIKSLGKTTIDEDFKRRPNIHHCFEILMV